jgi:hypothetical protein
MTTDFLEPQEEVVVIMDKIHHYLVASQVTEQYLPWETAVATNTRAVSKVVKITAIEDQFGVFPNGVPVPLTIRQRLLFGTPLKRLTFKITKVHQKCENIIKEMKQYKPWESDIKDTKLIRHFILECLSPFKRFALRVNSTAYDINLAKHSTWTVYILSWVFVTASLCFYMYWIFAWGIYNGEATLGAWGAVYGTGAAKDVLLVQVTKIYILYYLPAQAMQGQLLRIRAVLADVSMNCINRTDQGLARDINTIHAEHSLSVVQHMSAVCRASRSAELRHLPACWVLRQVIQYTRC